MHTAGYELKCLKMNKPNPAEVALYTHTRTHARTHANTHTHTHTHNTQYTKAYSALLIEFPSSKFTLL